MTYSPKHRLPTLEFQVRSTGDPVTRGWHDRAKGRGLTVAHRPGRAGAVRWMVRSDCAEIMLDQWPDRIAEVTLLEPSIGHLNLVTTLRATGLALPLARHGR